MITDTGKGQFLNFVEDSYLERTIRPIKAVFFLLPFLIFYELGTIFINTDILRHYWQGRVVAFASGIPRLRQQTRLGGNPVGGGTHPVSSSNSLPQAMVVLAP
jgi:hypothetical protein